MTQQASPVSRSKTARKGTGDDPVPRFMFPVFKIQVLPDRLHFIIDFFRCCQEDTGLFEPPFTLEQVEAFQSGRLPITLPYQRSFVRHSA